MYDRKLFHTWSQGESGFDTVIRNDGKYEFLELNQFARTGVAEGYYSTRRGGLEINLYKKLRLEEGQVGFRKFCEMIGVNPDRIITNRLTAITSDVRVVGEADLIDIYDEPLAPRADALVTNEKDLTLFLYAADCPLVYFLDPYRQVIALAHASWRTILKGVLDNTLHTMESVFGVSPWNMIVAIGPAIGACCFEVGEEVAEQFELEGFGDLIVRRRGEKPHLDLYGIVAEALMRRGINESRISVMRGTCTVCDNDRFESFRASKGNNALNGAFLTLR